MKRAKRTLINKPACVAPHIIKTKERRQTSKISLSIPFRKPYNDSQKRDTGDKNHEQRNASNRAAVWRANAIFSQYPKPYSQLKKDNAPNMCCMRIKQYLKKAVNLRLIRTKIQNSASGRNQSKTDRPQQCSTRHTRKFSAREHRKR